MCVKKICILRYLLQLQSCHIRYHLQLLVKQNFCQAHTEIRHLFCNKKHTHIWYKKHQPIEIAGIQILQRKVLKVLFIFNTFQ